MSVADLVIAVILALALAEALTFDVVGAGPIRVLLAVPFALFLPGYAFLAALFPGRADSEYTRGIDWPERLALSFAVSLAILPISMLGLSVFPGVALSTASIVTTLAGITVLGAIIGGGRRLSLPDDERLGRPKILDTWTRAGIRDRSPSKLVVDVLLVGSILLAATAVGYAFAAPEMSNPYTQFYLLHENPDGELVAGGYPSYLAVGQPATFVVGIENDETSSQTYTVVVQLQRLDGQTVTERAEVARYETQVEPGESTERELSVEPTMAGQDLRLTYLLYKETPPAEPSSENAYRRLYVWVDVVEP